MKLTITIIIALVLSAAPALAGRPNLPHLLQPRPSGPSCPFGYVASGSHCVPSRGASGAIRKPSNGTCPWGWSAWGSYCLRSGNTRR
jgi:hypothetical protein